MGVVGDFYVIVHPQSQNLVIIIIIIIKSPTIYGGRLIAFLQFTVYYYSSFSVKFLSRAVREDRLTGFFETWNLSTLGTEVVFFSNLGDTGALGVGQGEIIH